MEELNLTFKKLSPKFLDDYMYYFDNVAFSENDEYSLCYCLESHLTHEEDKALNARELRRNKAMEFIKSGVMTGYLVFLKGKPIAWCNVGDKEKYCTMADKEHETVDLKKFKVKAIYCMDISPKMRGKGIAHKILDKICADAKEEGYNFVEGYPFRDTKFPYQFHGPMKLYLEHSFEIVAEKSNFFIMSKKL